MEEVHQTPPKLEMDLSTRQICANGLKFDRVSLEMYASRIFFLYGLRVGLG